MSKFKFNTIEKLENAKTQLETIKQGIQSRKLDAESVILIVDRIYKLVDTAQEMRNLDE
jgi:hypothetical protein|tara:strand:- start:932 stop:1108 length:177 start_codon:yes stop_codon:yes gene_type:complete